MKTLLLVAILFASINSLSAQDKPVEFTTFQLSDTVYMLKGRGGMAQFNHPEFAGSAQWMNGGMMMLGDMFNQGLKARVDGLCQGLAAAISSQPDLFPRGSFQSQSQSGGGHQLQMGGGMAPMPPMSFGSGALFTPDPQDTWWPTELGSPSSSGAQNEVRYAYFPAAGRLAVNVNGKVSLYDTSGHQIAGLSQQQASGGGVMFSTGAGSISLTHLPSVSAPAVKTPPSAEALSAPPPSAPPASPVPTTITVCLRLLAGLTSFKSNRCLSHFC